MPWKALIELQCDLCEEVVLTKGQMVLDSQEYATNVDIAPELPYGWEKRPRSNTISLSDPPRVYVMCPRCAKSDDVGDTW